MSDPIPIIRSRTNLIANINAAERKTVEGGCGVIGIISTEPLAGRFIICPCEQMHNRGNGKGGGVAAVGLFNDRKDDYAIHVAYLDESVKDELEKSTSFPYSIYRTQKGKETSTTTAMSVWKSDHPLYGAISSE